MERLFPKPTNANVHQNPEPFFSKKKEEPFFKLANNKPNPNNIYDAQERNRDWLGRQNDQSKFYTGNSDNARIAHEKNNNWLNGKELIYIFDAGNLDGTIGAYWFVDTTTSNPETFRNVSSVSEGEPMTFTFDLKCSTGNARYKLEPLAVKDIFSFQDIYGNEFYNSGPIEQPYGTTTPPTEGSFNFKDLPNNKLILIVTYANDSKVRTENSMFRYDVTVVSD
jgi:hypothetical protein